MKKNKVSKTGIIVAVLMLAIGFAAVSTVLYINGTVNIGPNQDNFDRNVIFTATSWDEYSDGLTPKPTAEIGPAEINGVSIPNKKITFDSPVLKNIGQVATLSYTITNNSQYDGNFIGLTCTATDSSENDVADMSEYYSIDYLDATDADAETAHKITLAAKGGSYTGTIVVTQKKSYAGNKDKIVSNIECNINVVASPATEAASAGAGA